MTNNVGILLTNIGSPDQPTARAVRKYLRKFLSDKRVVELPRLLWYPILYGFILPLRSKNSAELYQKIWTPEGSPLTVNCERLANKLQEKLKLPVEVGMHYGNPSIALALEKLQQQKVKKIFVFPLYPQYSATTTASSFDHIANALKTKRDFPELQTLHDYADHPSYIDAIAHSIQNFWGTNGKPQHLLFSFHSLPSRYVELGDPYYEQCKLTAHLVTEKLALPKNEWSLAFQSRLRNTGWLTPYTDQVLENLPKQGIEKVNVICPGFAVDCLETLEEIAIRGQEQFHKAGGKEFKYIPALNDNDLHIQTITTILHNTYGI